MAVRMARAIRFRVATDVYQVGDVIGYEHDNPVPGTLRDVFKPFVDEITPREAVEFLTSRRGYSVEKAMRVVGFPIGEVLNLKPPKNQIKKFR